MTSDIDFIAGYEVVSVNWWPAGHLMLKDCGYMMKDVRDEITEMGLLLEPNSRKVTHLITLWVQLNRTTATAKALVDICSHPEVGGDRSQIVSSLSTRRMDLDRTTAVCTAVLLEVDSNSEFTKQLIDAVIDVASVKWKDIGRALGAQEPQLVDYERKQCSSAEKLRNIICLDWQRRVEDATVGHLLAGCLRQGRR